MSLRLLKQSLYLFTTLMCAFLFTASGANAQSHTIPLTADQIHQITDGAATAGSIASHNYRFTSPMSFLYTIDPFNVEDVQCHLFDYAVGHHYLPAAAVTKFAPIQDSLSFAGVLYQGVRSKTTFSSFGFTTVNNGATNFILVITGYTSSPGIPNIHLALPETVSSATSDGYGNVVLRWNNSSLLSITGNPNPFASNETIGEMTIVEYDPGRLIIFNQVLNGQPVSFYAAPSLSL